MTNPSTGKPGPGALPLILLIVLTLGEAVGLVPMLFGALFSPMAFDAPGSEKNPTVWLMFLLWAGTPLLLLALMVLAWVCFFVRWRRTAVGLSVLAGALMATAYIAFALLVSDSQ